MKETVSQNLFALIEDRCMKDSTLTIPKQAEAMGIPYQTLMKYLKGTVECSACNLAKMADYYEVSTDFILGRTRSKTLDPKLRELGVQLNLSDEAVQQLLTPWRYNGVETVMRYADQMELIQSVIDSFISKNLLFRIAGNIVEEKIRFTRYKNMLKELPMSEETAFADSRSALDLIKEWKLGNDGISRRLSELVPDYKEEYYRSNESFIDALQKKLSEIATSSDSDERRKYIDEYVDMLNDPKNQW